MPIFNKTKLVLVTPLGCLLGLQASAYPLRGLQEDPELGVKAAVAPEGKNCVQINIEGDFKCDEEKELSASDIEAEDATDSQIIAIIVGSILACVILLTAGIVLYTLCRHKKNLNAKKHLGIQLQRQVTETQKRVERRATLIQSKSLK